MARDEVVARLRRKVIFDADSAVIALQGTGATDAEKVRAVLDSAIPCLVGAIGEEPAERLREERDEFDERCADWIKEAERLRIALEWIDDCFVPGRRKTYGDPDETLHRIREKVAATLAGSPA